MNGDSDAVATLAEALGVARYQLTIAAGSLRQVDEIARSVDRGEMTIDEARRRLTSMHQERS